MAKCYACSLRPITCIRGDKLVYSCAYHSDDMPGGPVIEYKVVLMRNGKLFAQYPQLGSSRDQVRRVATYTWPEFTIGVLVGREVHG